jgi:hypothetical protein
VRDQDDAHAVELALDLDGLNLPTADVAWAAGASMRLRDAVDSGQAALGQSGADLTPQVVVAMTVVYHDARQALTLWLKVSRTFLMPQREARLMEQEGRKVLHLNFVLDVLDRGGEIAGTTQLATAVASPDLAGRVLRESPGQDLGPYKRLKVAALCLEHPWPPSVNGGRMCARAWEAVK